MVSSAYSIASVPIPRGERQAKSVGSALGPPGLALLREIKV
jgi:hypothetical protein